MHIFMKKTIKSTSVNIAALAACYGLMSFRVTAESIYLESIIFVISIYVLVSAAGKFTTLSVTVGKSLGLSKLATGILIIAIGTSAPELFASIGAAIQHRPNMVVGNVLGTVVANSLLGIGCGALVATRPLAVHKGVSGTQMSIFLAAIMLAIGGLFIGGLVWYEGLIMVVLLVCYLYYVIKSPNDDNVVAEDSSYSKKAETSMSGMVVLLIINLGALFISGDFVISSLIESAQLLGLSDTKLATSILAIGTSIPEIATAVVLVRQNNADSLFGEIIGSNIFDLLGILGVISLFGNLSIGSNLLVFLSASIFVMFIVTSIIMNDKRINRLEGIALISLFVIFTIQLVHV